MNIEDKHKALYDKIPSFKCKEGCTDCCGIIKASKWELKQLGGTPNNNKSLNCVFSKNGKCSKYDKRPLICRVYGTVADERIACPHGCRPDKLLSEYKANQIMKEYMLLTNEE